jgi:hypothetical protein
MGSPLSKAQTQTSDSLDLKADKPNADVARNETARVPAQAVIIRQAERLIVRRDAGTTNATAFCNPQAVSTGSTVAALWKSVQTL